MIEPVRRWINGTIGYRKLRSYRLRFIVQALFAFVCIVLGLQFARFLHAARAGELPLPVRPPGVEGFLPISGLMGIVDWFHRGELNTIHPAATILMTIFIVMAFLLRKAFCSWICPAGLFSETLARFGQIIFRRNFRPWRWLDIILRSIKYLLLLFFLQAIVRMSPAELTSFIESPYNRVSDIKMYLFFAEIGITALIVILLLTAGSIFINGFWCRYLCPYGALLGIFSLFSPVKIRRRGESCVDCGLCDKVCMARLPVSTRATVMSTECTGCLDCLAVCPVDDTLSVGIHRKRFTPVLFAAAVVFLFLAGYTGSRLTGTWRNRISDTEYVDRTGNLNSLIYGHPGMSSDTGERDPGNR